MTAIVIKYFWHGGGGEIGEGREGIAGDWKR